MYKDKNNIYYNTVNNAGIVSGTPLLETPDNKIIKTFEVNVFSHFWSIKVIKLFKPHRTNLHVKVPNDVILKGKKVTEKELWRVFEYFYLF